MDPQIVTVLTIVVIAFIVFVKEWLPVDVVGVLIILALIVADLLPLERALAGFGHPAVIGVGALFVVSEGLLRTGALGVLANRLERWSGGSDLRLRFLILVVVAASSAFLNNTPVVAMFIPVVIRLSQRLSFNPSRLLMPISYAAILGGTCTLIGTSTNLVVASIVERVARDPAGALGLDRPGLAEQLALHSPTMFEFSKLGLLIAAIGLTYLFLFSQRFLPERQTISSMTAGSHRHREYVTELAIQPGGKLVGVAFGESILADSTGVRVIQIIRGESIIWPPFHTVTLKAGDALVIAGNIENLLALQANEGLQTLDEILAQSEVEVSSRETELAEILVQPNSPYVGKTLEEAQFRLHFNLNVLAIQRHGMHLRKKISQHPLRIGDLLLVQGTDTDLHRVASEDGIVVMSEVDDVRVRPDKAPIAFGILMAVVVSLSVGVLPMAATALAGAVAMVLTGCLSVGKVYTSIHWRVLVLIAGTLALGEAMQSTGTAAWLAKGMVDIFDFGGPRTILVVALVLTALLTECVSNTAVAAIMIPVALSLAVQLEVSGMPFVMAIAYGASCSLLTPIGYQTNTLVYGAGGYRFADFFRLGAPLAVAIWTIGGIFIPLLWPF